MADTRDRLEKVERLKLVKESRKIMSDKPKLLFLAANTKASWKLRRDEES